MISLHISHELRKCEERMKIATEKFFSWFEFSFEASNMFIASIRVDYPLSSLMLKIEIYWGKSEIADEWNITGKLKRDLLIRRLLTFSVKVKFRGSENKLRNHFDSNILMLHNKTKILIFRFFFIIIQTLFRFKCLYIGQLDTTYNISTSKYPLKFYSFQ